MTYRCTSAALRELKDSLLDYESKEQGLNTTPGAGIFRTRRARTLAAPNSARLSRPGNRRATIREIPTPRP
jgi:hypothetical protein